MHNEFVTILFLFIVAISPNSRVLPYGIISFDVEYTDDKPDLNDAQAIARVIYDEKEEGNRDATALYFFRQQTLDQRVKVDEEFKKINNGQSLIPEDHRLLVDNTLKDVLFAMLRGPLQTKMRFLKNIVCDTPDDGCDLILREILIVEDTNRGTLLQEFQKDPSTTSFEDCVQQKYQNDYKNFLLELCHRSRAPDIAGDPNVDEVKSAVDDLNGERKGKEILQKGWKYKRSVLDDQLMAKSKKFAQAVLTKYAESNGGNQLRDDIPKKIEDENLICGYQSLIDFIQTPYKFIATRIHDATLDFASDGRSTLILFGVGYSGTPELGKIDEAFKELYKTPLKSFLESECKTDAVCDTVHDLLP